MDHVRSNAGWRSRDTARMEPRDALFGCRRIVLAGVGGQLRFIAPVHSGANSVERNAQFVGARTNVGTASLCATDELGAKESAPRGTLTYALAGGQPGGHAHVTGVGQCSAHCADDSFKTVANTSRACAGPGGHHVVRTHGALSGAQGSTEIHDSDRARVSPRN